MPTKLGICPYGKNRPRRLHKYILEFKLKSVKMSEEPGIAIKAVAEALCIQLDR